MNILSMFSKHSSPLAYKILITILISTIVTTILIIAIQLKFEYSSSMTSIQQKFNQIENKYIKTFSANILSSDKTKYKSTLNEILNIENIVYVELSTINADIILSKGTNQKDEIISKEFIFKTIQNEPVKLVVVASLNEIYDSLINNAFIILITQGINILIISLIILFTFYTLITRHLNNISNYAKNIDINSNDKLILNRCINKKEDELDFIVFALNNMKEKTKKSYLIINKLNQNLEEKVNERTLELTESLENFEYLFNNTLEAIGLFQDNICVDINDAGVKFFDFKDKSEALGKTPLDFVAPDSYELIKEKIANPYNNPYEANAIKQDGTIFPVLIRSHLKNIKGKLTRVTTAFDLTELKKREKELEEANKELIKLSNIDPLTGAFNRRYLYTVVQKIIYLAKREKKNLCIAMIDIDDFKDINDTFGHDIGDKVLIATVDEINYNIRQSDVLVRFGGEEFIIVFPSTDLKNALFVSEKIRKAIENYTLIKKVKFTISIGVSEFDIIKDDDIEKSIKRADIALYKAKKSGKNKILFK